MCLDIYLLSSSGSWVGPGVDSLQYKQPLPFISICLTCIIIIYMCFDVKKLAKLSISQWAVFVFLLFF